VALPEVMKRIRWLCSFGATFFLLSGGALSDFYFPPTPCASRECANRTSWLAMALVVSGIYWGILGAISWLEANKPKN
jgi:hypothetical protein